MQLRLKHKDLSFVAGEHTQRQRVQPCSYWSARNLSLVSVPLSLWSMSHVIDSEQESQLTHTHTQSKHTQTHGHGSAMKKMCESAGVTVIAFSLTVRRLFPSTLCLMLLRITGDLCGHKKLQYVSNGKWNDLALLRILMSERRMMQQETIWQQNKSV